MGTKWEGENKQILLGRLLEFFQTLSGEVVLNPAVQI
jgi:hypothetical protein